MKTTATVATFALIPTTLTESIRDLFEKQTTKLLSWRIYTLRKGRYSDKQTTKLHFRYASHVAFRL